MDEVSSYIKNIVDAVGPAHFNLTDDAVEFGPYPIILKNVKFTPHHHTRYNIDFETTHELLFLNKSFGRVSHSHFTKCH